MKTLIIVFLRIMCLNTTEVYYRSHTEQSDLCGICGDIHNENHGVMAGSYYKIYVHYYVY